MSTRQVHIDFDTFYFITFTCFQWISLFDIIDLYDFIYKCFDINKAKKIYNCGYVIMPNHLHKIVYTENDEDTINDIIGETKRFMAYEIVKRLKKSGRKDLLKIMHESVEPRDSAKGQLHNVFEPSADIKRIVTEKLMKQKLNYIHRNPVSGKWKLVENYVDYIHSSAAFYVTGRQGVYEVIHYTDILPCRRVLRSENKIII